jgi:cell division protein FtsB
MRDASSATFLVPLCLLIFAIVAVPTLMFDGQGVPRYSALSREIVRVRAKNAFIEREVRELREQTRRLRSDPRAIERIARDELGMVRPGEVVFQFQN